MSRINEQSGDYSLQPQDDNKLIVFNSASAVTLSIPHEPWFSAFFDFSISNIGSGVVTITPASATIDGAASLTLEQFDGVTLYCDGTNWLTVRGVASGSGGGGGGGSFAYSALPVPPALSDFTWVNQSAASATASQGSLGAILMTLPALSSLEWSILAQAVPTAPWTVEAFLGSGQYGTHNSGASSAGGLYLYDGTKLLGLELLVQNDAGTGPFGELRVERITNVTTDDSTAYGPVTIFQNVTGGMYLRWRNDGSTLHAEFSPDGENYLTLYGEAVGSFITPTYAGFGGADITAGGSPNSQYISVRGWQISS